MLQNSKKLRSLHEKFNKQLTRLHNLNYQKTDWITTTFYAYHVEGCIIVDVSITHLYSIYSNKDTVIERVNNNFLSFVY